MPHLPYLWAQINYYLLEIIPLSAIRAAGKPSKFRVTALCKRADQVFNRCIIYIFYRLKLMDLIVSWFLFQL
jgi:hypothetical protein